jgi:M6 family metalloprotease-like protein
MKKSLKAILICLTVLVLLSAFAVCSYAVPAYNANGATGTCKSHTNKLVTLDDIPSRIPENTGARKLQKVNITKNIPLVVIVIGFRNISYNDSYNWGDVIFQSESSLKKYYSDMSFGQFTFEPVSETSAYKVGGNTNKYDVENDGIIHVKLDSDHDNWALQPGLLIWNQSVNLTKSIINAIKAANAYIDFSQYDDDKDGLIENNEMALSFVFAGYEAAYQTSYNLFSFWSHAFSVSESIEAYNLNLSVPKVDGVKVDSYIGIAEKLEENTQEPICVLAHELGHYLGLPDLYDTVYSTSLEWSPYDVAHLSVMCSGVWCEDEENGTYSPASMDAWSRYELGWIKPTTVNRTTDVELTSQDYSNPSEKIKTALIPTQTANEYYLVENRQFTGWDRFLGEYFSNDRGGVVIWHIDKNIYNENYELNSVNNTDHRPSVIPLYPEKVDSVYTFTGKGGVVYSPFFDSAVWESKFATDIGDSINLPLYGSGKNANSRLARTLSGIKVSFLDESASTMHINVNVDNHVHKATHLSKAPTCLKFGYNDCYYCSYCRKYFSDSSCINEIFYSDAIILATGHSYVFSRTVKPMADADGYDLHICERCGAEKKDNFKKLVGWGQDSKGNWYFVKDDGSFLKGWQTIEGRDGKTNKFYFGSDGIMFKSRLASINSKKYYFGSDGAMYKSRLISVSGKKYYMGSDGAAYTKRLISVNGKKYYMGADGAAYTKRLISVNGKKYYMGSDGVAYKSRLISVEGKKYYIGKDCVAYKSRFASLSGKKYYFGSDCVMLKNTSKKIDGKTYYFNKNGVCTNP